jgi:hypothetical protein
MNYTLVTKFLDIEAIRYNIPEAGPGFTSAERVELLDLRRVALS